jgi:serine phosphatase RsbU (regulator of sigma subunit)
VAYSDGITEADNQAGRPFDEDGLERAVRTFASSPAPDLARTLFTSVEQHVGNVKLSDDQTVVVVKRTDSPRG